MQIAGFLAALAAVWLLAGGSGRAIARNDWLHTTLAGLGFGLYFVLIDQATDAGVFWNLAFARTLGGLLLLGIVLATHKPLLPGRAVWPLNLAARAYSMRAAISFLRCKRWRAGSMWPRCLRRFIQE